MRTDTVACATGAARNLPVRPAAVCFTRLGLHLAFKKKVRMSSQSLDAVESAGGEDMPVVAATMVAAVLEKASIPPSKGPENAKPAQSALWVLFLVHGVSILSNACAEPRFEGRSLSTAGASRWMDARRDPNSQTRKRCAPSRETVPARARDVVRCCAWCDDEDSDDEECTSTMYT